MIVILYIVQVQYVLVHSDMLIPFTFLLTTTSFDQSLSPIFLSPTDTTRDPHADEDPNSFYFVQEDSMRAEIMQHKFIEFGKHQQHLYGIKADSVVDVIHSGKMCIMDVHPQVRERGHGHSVYHLAVYSGVCVCVCVCAECRWSRHL